MTLIERGVPLWTLLVPSNPLTNPMDKPTFQTGSLLNSSEGLTTTGLMGLVTTVMMGDASDQVKMASVIALAVAIAAYGVSRGLAKKDAK